jgi:rhamnulokinase
MRQWEREGLHPEWDSIITAAAEAPPCKTWIDPDARCFQSPGNMPETIHNYCSTTGQQAQHPWEK